MYKKKIAFEMYKIVKRKERHRLEGMNTIIRSKGEGDKIVIKRLKPETERNMLKWIDIMEYVKRRVEECRTFIKL